LSENYHSIDDDLSSINGVEITILIGTGLPTVGQLQEKVSQNFIGIRSPKYDEIQVNGDGAVPVFSASLNDPSKGINLAGEARVLYTQFDHGGLPSSDQTHMLIKNVLNNNSDLPAGIQVTPTTLEGQQVSVHSPVEIHAYDSAGNQMATTGQITLAGVSFVSSDPNPFTPGGRDCGRGTPAALERFGRKNAARRNATMPLCSFP
jgi:hypothetical protein